MACRKKVQFCINVARGLAGNPTDPRLSKILADPDYFDALAEAVLAHRLEPVGIDAMDALKTFAAHSDSAQSIYAWVKNQVANDAPVPDPRPANDGVKLVEVQGKERVFSKFFKIDDVTLRYQKQDGGMSEPIHRLVFERGDAVAAILHNPRTNRVIVVNQLRVPTLQKSGGWITEVAAGMLEEGEDPAEAMEREILEETGYAVASIEPISSFFVSPGGSSERIHLMYAELGPKLQAGGGLDGESEDIEVREYGVEDYLAMLERGELVDAKTIIAAMWLKAKMGKW